MKTIWSMNVFGLHRLLLLLILALCHFRISQPIKCYVGYGQRGLKYSNEISWVRTCPQSSYCFEAVTFDVSKAQKLVNYPWVRFQRKYLELDSSHSTFACRIPITANFSFARAEAIWGQN